MANLHHAWLMELTSLPTAAGCEAAVVRWIEQWAAQRPALVMQKDQHGNITLRKRRVGKGKPIYITAHLDHPAFVVTDVKNNRRITAEFRGGVNNEYFAGAKVVWHGDEGQHIKGVVKTLEVHKRADGSMQREVEIELTQAVPMSAVQKGQVITWDLPAAKIKGDRLHAPACDDLAGVAAALAAMDLWLQQTTNEEALADKLPVAHAVERPADKLPVAHGDKHTAPAARDAVWHPALAANDLRLLLTRAEEIGFVGAIGACKVGTIPQGARVVALECSRSFKESPVGGGPIVRVGDRTSTFDPALTYRVGQIAGELQAEDATFRWQRKLMPGGTCEATAYLNYGYQATCVCLPLLNYHNMKGLPTTPPAPLTSTTLRVTTTKPGAMKIDRAKVGSEVISVRDFDYLVRLLVAVATRLDDTAKSPTLRKTLEGLFVRGRGVLDK